MDYCTGDPAYVRRCLWSKRYSIEDARGEGHAAAPVKFLPRGRQQREGSGRPPDFAQNRPEIVPQTGAKRSNFGVSGGSRGRGGLGVVLGALGVSRGVLEGFRVSHGGFLRGSGGFSGSSGAFQGFRVLRGCHRGAPGGR